MKKVIEQISKCDNLTETEKNHIIDILQKYKNEPYLTKCNVKLSATTLTDLFQFNSTIEGSAFWTEINWFLTKNQPTEQTELDLFK